MVMWLEALYSIITLSGRTLTDAMVKGKTIAQALYVYKYTKGLLSTALQTFW